MSARDTLRTLNEQRLELEQTLEAAHSRLRRLALEEVDVADLEARAELGQEDASEAATTRTELDNGRAQAERDVRVKTGALERLGQQIELAKQDVARDDIAAGTAEIEQRHARKIDGGKQFQGQLAAGIKSARLLLREREEIQKLHDELRVIASQAGVDTPPLPDEPDWRPDDGWQELVNVVTQGPYTPTADAERRRADEAFQLAQRSQEADNRLISWAGREATKGNPGAIDRIPERLRDTAQQYAETLRELDRQLSDDREADSQARLAAELPGTDPRMAEHERARLEAALPPRTRPPMDDERGEAA